MLKYFIFINCYVRTITPIQSNLLSALRHCQRNRPQIFALFDELDLTYPQYLVMLTLWEFGEQSVGEIGDKLHLNSGTLTPLLKRLQSKDLIARTRSQTDERTVIITLTNQGRALEHQAVNIPNQVSDCLNLTADEVAVLQKIASQLNH